MVTGSSLTCKLLKEHITQHVWVSDVSDQNARKNRFLATAVKMNEDDEFITDTGSAWKHAVPVKVFITSGYKCVAVEINEGEQHASR